MLDKQSWMYVFVDTTVHAKPRMQLEGLLPRAAVPARPALYSVPLSPS